MISSMLKLRAMRLKDKVAIVTGAGSGFGSGIAQRFAAAGAHVIINDIDRAAAEQVTLLINNKGHSAVPVVGDVSCAKDMARMVARGIEHFGSLDIMVNNAGITHTNRSMLDVDEATFERVFAVNVKACYLSALNVIPQFINQGRGGVILNIASIAGLRPRPGLTWYCASKGALIAMTRAMAVELAEKSIRVNALCPVAGDTPLLPRFLADNTSEAMAAMISTIPMGRLATPGDIADAALFMVSDEASFITGSILEVDGGRGI